MEPEIKKAWIVAGIKLAVGLFVLLGVVSLRIVAVPSSQIESDIAELDHLQSTLAKAAPAVGAPENVPGAAGAEASAPNHARSSASASQPRDAAGTGDADPNRIVACQIAGGRQFMSGGDCALRGGQAKEF